MLFPITNPQSLIPSLSPVLAAPCPEMRAQRGRTRVGGKGPAAHRRFSMVCYLLFRKIMEIQHLRLAHKMRNDAWTTVNSFPTARKQRFLRALKFGCGGGPLAKVAKAAVFCPRTRAQEAQEPPDPLLWHWLCECSARESFASKMGSRKRDKTKEEPGRLVEARRAGRQ
jgi:hypothetical protein